MMTNLTIVRYKISCFGVLAYLANIFMMGPSGVKKWRLYKKEQNTTTQKSGQENLKMPETSYGGSGGICILKYNVNSRYQKYSPLKIYFNLCDC